MLRAMTLLLAVGWSQALVADDDGKKDREVDNVTHRLMDRVEKLEKQIAELEASLKPRIHPLPHQHWTVPTPPAPLHAPGKPNDYPLAPRQPPIPPHAPAPPLPPSPLHPGQSGMSVHPVYPGQDGMAGHPQAGHWPRLQLNGQWFYMVPVEQAGDIDIQHKAHAQMGRKDKGRKHEADEDSHHKHGKGDDKDQGKDKDRDDDGDGDGDGDDEDDDDEDEEDEDDEDDDDEDEDDEDEDDD